MSNLLKPIFYDNTNIVLKDQNCNYIFKKMTMVDDEYTNLKILNTAIDKHIYLEVIDSKIKKSFIQRLTKENKYLEIKLILEGQIEQLCQETKEKNIYIENQMSIEFKKNINEYLLNKKGQHYRYICISINEDCFKENDFLRKNNFASAKRIFFRPDIAKKFSELFCKKFDNYIDSLFLKINTFELIIDCIEELKKNNNKLLIGLNDEDKKRIYKAKYILDNFYKENLTISILSKKVAINQTKLKKGFKLIFDRPIHDYLKNVRLKSAYFYLKSNKYSIKEVSLMSGYKNQGSFTYAFVKKYNCLPKDIAKKSNL